VAAASQEAWPEAGWRCSDISRKSRKWNADRRARPQRRVGASRSLRGAPRTRWCGQFHLRLSAFRFLPFLSFFRHCGRSAFDPPRTAGEVASKASRRGPEAERTNERVPPYALSHPNVARGCGTCPLRRCAGKDQERRCLKTESENAREATRVSRPRQLPMGPPIGPHWK
jgi:hypothetical protein